MRPLCFLALFLAALVARPQTAQPSASNAPPSPLANISFGPVWQPRCEQSLATILPAEAGLTLPHQVDASGQPSAEAPSMAFFYGIDNHPQDFIAARRAAWQERSIHDAHSIGSTLVLAMIYANGLGTPRDASLTLRMACEAGFTPRELNRITAVANGPPDARFDLCPANPAGDLESNRCDHLNAALARQRLNNEITAFAAAWPSQQQHRLRQLEDASALFFRLSSAWESSAFPAASAGGFSAERFYTLIPERLHAQLLDLANFEAGHPRTTPLTAAQADTQLNSTFQHLLDQLRQGTIDTNAPILFDVPTTRNIQRAWLSYRDAWLALIAARYGQPAASAWQAQLSLDREHTLQALSRQLPPIDASARPWLVTCAHARETPLPAIPAPATDQLSLSVCGSARAYYGLGRPVDFAAARSCALEERAIDIIYGTHAGFYDRDFNPQASEVDSALNGSLVLAMLYANGDGVARDIPLATRFACEAIEDGQVGPGSDDTPTIAGLSQLYTSLLDATQKPEPHLDLCNFVPGPTRMLDECGEIARVRAAQQLDHDLLGPADRFTGPQRSAYLHLVATLRAYYEAHDAVETLTLPFAIDDGTDDGIHVQREHAFLDDLHSFEQGHLPHATLTNYTAADRSLNLAFHQALTPASSQAVDGVPPTPANIRSTQRLWLAYRDAWAAFGVLRYPQTTRESWLTWITRQRTADLSNPSFFGDTP